jgi:hypothetical protein
MRTGHVESRKRTQISSRKVRKLLQHGRVLLVVALAPVVLLSGCSGLVSAGGTAPHAAIQVTPSSLNLGSVVVGKKVSQIVSVANTGNISVNISQANLSSSQFSVSGLAMPLSLSVGQSSSFQISFNATSAGNVTATFTVQTDTGVSSEQVALTGTATAVPQQISVNPAALNLGSVTVGTTAKGTVTLSNLGGSNLTISLISVSGGPFSVSGITTPSTIAPGGSASLNVAYSPTAAGSSSGGVIITSDDPQKPTSVISLSGTGTAAPVAPTITTPPVNQTVTAGQTATFTVVAAGTAPLSYQWQKHGANIAGATAASYTTPATTTSDGGSTFAVVVSNTAAGTVTSAAATLTVNASPVAGIQVSSSSINFGNDVVGSNSSQALIITNTGTATLTITHLTETGSAFSVSGFSLPLNVSAGQQTTILVTFRPSTVGAASGNISIVSNAPASPTSVGLSGTGIAATLTLGIRPTSLSFGNVTTGTSSASQNVTITNTGNSNVTISQITLSGSGYSMTGGSAPVTLSPSQSLTLVVQFSPRAAGSVNGSISIVNNASGSPASVSLSGTGVAPVQHSVVLSWNASTSTVAGYNVYRRAVSGDPYTKINSSLVAALNYTDSTVQSGTTYFYVTTAVDSSGSESVYSNEVSATVP